MPGGLRDATTSGYVLTTLRVWNPLAEGSQIMAGHVECLHALSRAWYFIPEGSQTVAGG